MVFFDNPLNGADNEFSRDLARIERRQRNFHLPHVRRVRRTATIGSRYMLDLAATSERTPTRWRRRPSRKSKASGSEKFLDV